MTKIYHNPRCSKSRATLALLQENNLEPQVILYLETPPSHAELEYIVSLLGVPVEQIIRKGESIYNERALEAPSEAELIDLIVQHPILLERPIVVHNQSAVIGRPPENILKLL